MTSKWMPRRSWDGRGTVSGLDPEMATLIDTNILIDIAVRDPAWSDWSRRQLLACLDGGMIINPVIFAEFSLRYGSLKEAQDAINLVGLVQEHMPFDGAYLAGRAFRVYRSRGGVRHSTLPDFFIGGHALVRGYAILTRDTSGYRSYFPDVPLIAPDTHP